MLMGSQKEYETEAGGGKRGPVKLSLEDKTAMKTRMDEGTGKEVLGKDSSCAKRWMRDMLYFIERCGG